MPSTLRYGRNSSTAGTGSDSASSGSQIRAASRQPSASVSQVCSISRIGHGNSVRVVTGEILARAGYDRSVSEAVRTRIGGHVVAEGLESLGAETAFGLPGVHALGIWEGLGRAPFATSASAPS